MYTRHNTATHFYRRSLQGAPVTVSLYQQRQYEIEPNRCILYKSTNIHTMYSANVIKTTYKVKINAGIITYNLKFTF